MLDVPGICSCRLQPVARSIHHLAVFNGRRQVQDTERRYPETRLSSR